MQFSWDPDKALQKQGDNIRIISARRATAHERKNYEA
jgi:uncharacterized DUF497 family protein